MADWMESISCVSCGQKLNLPFDIEETVFTCSSCSKKYKLSIVQLSYAVADSNSCDYYRFLGTDEIEIRSFCNFPVDLLEEAWQECNAITGNGQNPHLLLPLIKKYHDAVKSHARRFLQVNRGSLNSQEFQAIEKDNVKALTLNIKTLFDYLSKAHPHKTGMINTFYSANESLIKRIWWVRNKQEHILFSKWPINAKVFEDLNKNPDDPDPAPDRLNCNFAKRVNNLCVDFYKLIIDLRPGTPEAWQYCNIEQFRIA